MTAVAAHGIAGLVRSALRAPIPHALRADLGFAVALLALFLIQVGTGILLSLYFQPSPEAVGDSVRFIMRDVDWGWLIRGIHRWSSPALAILCGAHLLRLFAAGRYRSGQHWMWYLGVFVFALLLVESFSGSVLCWDDVGYWRVRRLLEGVETLPLAGPALADALRGGPEVGAATLSRAATIHTLFTPWLMSMLLLANVALLARRIFRREGGGA